jgi:hypothetical protein
LCRLVEEARAEVLRSLKPGQLATVEARVLRQLDGEAPRSGSKPLLSLEDADGQRFVLKLADPALMAVEQTAYELRALAGRPCIPARVVAIGVDGLGRVEGLLKPYVELTSAELGTDTCAWSELQRAVILLEHAWEWFLDNLDTNTSQYTLLGSRAYPLNIDWDRAFADAGKSELSRFAKYKRTLPNARTFLYADYVEGRLELPFELLLDEAECIRSLPDSAVRPILERYAAVRYGDDPMAQEFVERVIERQRSILGEVARLIADLEDERRLFARARGAGMSGRLRANAIHAWKQWQLALNAVFRGPIGHAGRLLLKHVRGARLSPRAVIPHHRSRSAYR